MNHWTPSLRRAFVLAWATCALVLAPGAQSAFAKDASADIDQCANGALTALAICQGTQYQNGNLNGNQAHWFEGDSVPYRLKLADLAPDTTYTVQIEWDTTKAGKHAVDYLTSYDRTETAGAADVPNFHLNQNDPCSDYLGAGCLGAPSTTPIPDDTHVTTASGQHPATLPGGQVFTMWGASLSAVVPAFTLTGDYTGDSSTSLNISFHTAADTNGLAVLAWAGHIGTRSDWGRDNSAIAIAGSPYHMRLLNLDPPNRGGNQDRSLTADAVIFPADVTVTKDVVPDSLATFGFSATGATFPYPTSADHSGSFTLGDGGSITSDKIVFFPGSGTIAETQPTPSALWSTSVVCSYTPGVLGSGGDATPSSSTHTLNSSFTLNEGDSATCAYTNTFSKLSPPVSTTASAGDVVSSSLKVHDSTHVGPGYQPGGTVYWRLYDNSTCSGTPILDETTLHSDIANPDHLDTISVDSPDVNATDLVPGTTYHWVSRYGGDSNNSPTSFPVENAAACSEDSEDVTIGKATPHVHTTVSGQRVGLGHSVTDHATLTGGFQPGGTVTFRVYGPTDKSEPTCADEGTNKNLVATFTDVAQSEDGSWTSPPFTAQTTGHYVFVAHYNGDTNNLADTGSCADTAEAFDVFSVAVNVVKDPDQDHAYDGDKVSFTISATNVGTESLTNVALKDNIQGTTHTCETLSGPTGDTNGNGELDPGETWKWTCTVTVIHSEENAQHQIVNLAHIEGDTKIGGEHVVSNVDDATIPVLHPAIAIDKTGPATGQAGDKIGYVLTVTNPGDAAFADSTVKVADAQCNGDPVTLIGKGGDGSPASLDPGDVWTYGCSVQTAVGDTAVHNTATVTGCDKFGTCVNDDGSADTTLTQPEQLLLPTRIVPGAARLVGPTGCVAKAFNARVRGTKVATVTFVLDGKIVKKIANTKNAQLIQLRLNPAKMRTGVHRLVVNVTFQSGSGTKPKTLRLSFQRCAKKLSKPRFTG